MKVSNILDNSRSQDEKRLLDGCLRPLELSNWELGGQVPSIIYYGTHTEVPPPPPRPLGGVDGGGGGGGCRLKISASSAHTLNLAQLSHVL